MINEVAVTGGRINGLAVRGELRAFLGIPFAASPLGIRRWCAPEPVAPWDGVRDATRFAPRPVQPVIAPVGDLPSVQAKLFFPPARYGQSEDCLYLNVWTAARPGDRRPVMVWIYGGGFRAGDTANPLYNGEELARAGVVVVSIAYRVWKFGFLAHPELSAASSHRASGNYGLLDQIAALRWVRDNIERFGGDPGNVTIFGQSAGAASVCYLSVSPLAKGLFARAIAQSGGAFFNDAAARSAAKPLAEAEREGADWLARRGARSIAYLRALPADELLEDVRVEGFRSSWPVIDGYVLTEQPAAAFARGAHTDVPLLTGSNADEDTVTFARQNWAWVNAQATRGRAPAYYYYFTHALPIQDGTYLENRTRSIGATHGAEIPYVFGTIEAFAGASEADRELARTLMRYWVNFATKGDPNGPGLAAWPRFDAAAPLAMELKPQPAVMPVSGR